jgi:hypothetical protein
MNTFIYNVFKGARFFTLEFIALYLASLNIKNVKQIPMKKIVLAISLLVGLNSFAQNRACSTMENFDRLKNNHPEMISQMEEIEVQTQNFIQSQQTSRTIGGTNSVMVVRNIPVVVHVLYNTSAQNISDAQILSQITILNNDFRKLNADRVNVPSTFSALAVDAEINFCLASVSPTGSATTGITRTQTSVTSFSTDDKMKSTATGGVNPWSTDKYLNIWVCNLGGGILGYAQFPGGPVSTDGVVIGYNYFGNTGTAVAPFNKGRTGTHEVGHWLNLRHIWGDAACGSDLVSDTPTHNTSNYGCPSHPKSNSCGTTAEMWMNYMDYTDDACMYMFSSGQKTRMQALFGTGGARSSLLTSNGCGTASTPTTTCSTPSGLTTSSLTASSVTTNWGAVTGASSYNVRIKSQVSTTWTNSTSTTTSRAFSGLTASTGYEFQVQTVCSSGTSAYSTSRTFTTTATTTPTGATLTVGAGTGTTTIAPYGTYYMDQKVQFIMTKAELVAAGYTSANNVLRSLAFNAATVSSQTMNAFTIKMRHTTASSFSSTSFMSATGMITVHNANKVATTGWNTHTFTTPFNYNGTDNVLIEICWNNSSYTTDSKVFATTLSTNNTLYTKADVASGGVCANTTGTLSTTRPNMRFYFSGNSTAPSARIGDEEIVEAIDLNEVELAVKLFPNPTSSLLNVEYTTSEEESQAVITVYNMMGSVIASFEENSIDKGAHTFVIDMNTNDKLSQLSNGIYLCSVSLNGQMKTARFAIQK